MLFLDSSDAATSVLHALALLQRPTSTGQPQAQSLGINAHLQPDAAHLQPPISDTVAGASEQASQHVQSSTSVSLPGVAVKTDDTAPPAVTAEESSASAAAPISTSQAAGAAVSDTPMVQQKSQGAMLAESNSGDVQFQFTCVCCLSCYCCDNLSFELPHL